MRHGGILLWACLPALAAAQSADDAYQELVTRCESRDGERVYCAMDVRHGAQLVRQLSPQDCIREAGWGVDEAGLWVDQGCRAEFAPANARRSGVLTRRVVRCESKTRPQSCAVTLKGAPVRVLRQLGLAPCKRDHSWGVRRNEIWVSRGCSADFEIGAADGSGFLDLPRQVTCESKKKLRRECGVGVSRRVTLIRQLSSTACEEGISWGWDRDGVWVDNGCRGEFSVD